MEIFGDGTQHISVQNLSEYAFRCTELSEAVVKNAHFVEFGPKPRRSIDTSQALFFEFLRQRAVDESEKVLACEDTAHDFRFVVQARLSLDRAYRPLLRLSAFSHATSPGANFSRLQDLGQIFFSRCARHESVRTKFRKKANDSIHQRLRDDLPLFTGCQSRVAPNAGR